jgi:hypothetical protein
MAKRRIARSPRISRRTQPRHVLAGQRFTDTMNELRDCSAELLGIVRGFQVLCPTPPPGKYVLLENEDRTLFALHTLVVGGALNVQLTLAGLVERLERCCQVGAKAVA